MEMLNSELERLRRSEQILLAQLQSYNKLVEASRPKPAEQGWMETAKQAASLVASLFGVIGSLFSGFQFTRGWLQKRREANA
jgi:hypothetical protein